MAISPRNNEMPFFGSSSDPSNPFEEENIDGLLKNLQEQFPKKFRRCQDKHIFDDKKDLFYCWIKEDLHNCIIGDPAKFRFGFNMFIPHNNNVYKYMFTATYHEIKSVHKTFKHYFPNTHIPKLGQDTKNWRKQLLEQRVKETLDTIQSNGNNPSTQDINWYHTQIKEAIKSQNKDIDIDAKSDNNDDNDQKYDIDYIMTYINQKLERNTTKMAEMEEYMMLDDRLQSNGPGRVSWFSREKRKATAKDAHNLSKILCQIFNCTFLVLNDKLYDYFNRKTFVHEMKKLIQNLGYKYKKKLENLSGYKDKSILMKNKHNYQDLYKQQKLHYMEFNRFYVVKKASKYHWALKFEGFAYLLSMDFFAHDRVYVQILDNNALGHKIFWFGDVCHLKRVTYTKSWNILYKQNLKSDNIINGGRIGYFIDIWLNQYSEPIYNPMSNNCQHFVRDLLSIIDRGASYKLTKQLQRIKISQSIFPSNIQQQEYKRINRFIKLHNKMEKIYTFLESIQLEKYFYTFISNKNYDDIQKLKTINAKQLKRIGIEKGHIKQFLNNI